MPNTYTQLLVQLVFAVRGRQYFIKETFRVELEKYITGVLTNRKNKMLAIYCMPDHTHILIGLNPAYAISDLVKEIKIATSNFIKKKYGTFFWQEGYGAFTYSRSHLDNVVRYILNQPLHHKQRTFQNEYMELLEKFEIEFDSNYVFEFYDIPKEEAAQLEP